MMSELADTLNQLASRWNYKLDEISTGIFRMDVGIKLKDGSFRYQFVYIQIIQPQNGKRKYYMNSRCGMYTPQANLYSIMKEAGYCNYSTITITNDKTADGNPFETIFVLAAPFVEHSSVDLLSEIIFEVANNADILEAGYFGGDNN